MIRPIRSIRSIRSIRLARRHATLVPLSLLLLLTSLPALAGEEGHHAECPMHAQHQAQAAEELDARGDQVMGFDHTRTTHHFRRQADGGSVEVEVVDPADAESLAQIRHHLRQVAESFAQGDFSMPRAIHDRVLPGVPEMIRLGAAIEYRYEEIENGARVRFQTADPEARAAIHEFLQAQTTDHRTGD